MIRTFGILFLFFAILPTTQAQSYLLELKSSAQFDSFCATPLSNKYGGAKAVKIVYHVKESRLYYINGNRFRLHYDFCEKQLKYRQGFGNFRRNNYSGDPKRQFLLANLNYFQNLDEFVLDLSTTDQMNPEQIELLISSVKKTSFLSRPPSFLINGPRLEKIEKKLPESIVTIHPKDIYESLSFQAISKYQNHGILRIVKPGQSNYTQYTPNDILVLSQVPDYLPPVAGVIVTEFQTPLSHVSILGLNRKIPICAYTRAFTNKTIAQYANQKVKLKVYGDTFILTPSTGGSTQKIKKSKIPLKINLIVDSLVGIAHVRKRSSVFVGTKAANFGELHYLSSRSNFKTPEAAFAIPFYFYKQHLKHSKTEGLIKELLGNLDLTNEAKISLLLKIQQSIKEFPLDSFLLEQVERRMKNSSFSRFRFRSSTNAEDIKGFSGAGLYVSKGAQLNSVKKSISRAIKTVWASTWSVKAYKEREFFRVDHKNVAMGILVHRSFPNEKVNGVAITKNIYRSNSAGFVVNTQKGNENVVSQTQGMRAEQFICFPSRFKRTNSPTVVDVITHSSLTDSLLMTPIEIQNLADQLEIIKMHFVKPKMDTWHYNRFGLDIEFKIDTASRQLYIKQVRPYND